MNYTAHDFKPANPVLIIDGMDIEFSLLTLSKTVKLQELYGEIHEMFQLIEQSKDKEILFDILWHLVLDKSIFNHRAIQFKTFLKSMPLNKVGQMLINTIHECVNKSMPLVINKKRMEEIKKVQTANENSEPCYGKFYDMISKRYSVTLDNFYELTLRQISIMLEVISSESYSELEVQAKLAGKKLKPRIEYNQVSPEQEKENEQEALDTVARLKKEWEEKQKNKDK